jgi:spore germination protein
MRIWRSKIRKTRRHAIESEKKEEYRPYEYPTGHFTGDFTLDLELIKQEIGHNSDVHFREFSIGRTGIRAAIIFVEGLSDKDLIDQHIMKSLMVDFFNVFKQEPSYVKETISKSLLKTKFFPLVK